MSWSSIWAAMDWQDLALGIMSTAALIMTSLVSYRVSKEKTKAETKSNETVSIQSQMTEFMRVVTQENKEKTEEIKRLKEEIAELKLEIRKLRAALRAHEALE